MAVVNKGAEFSRIQNAPSPFNVETDIRSTNASRNGSNRSWCIPRPSLILLQDGGGSDKSRGRVPKRETARRDVRGSTSTQGSNSSSNHSTQSAKSGSLLLTVANLARIDQIDVNSLRGQQHAINIQYYLEQQDRARSGEIEKIHKNGPIVGGRMNLAYNITDREEAKAKDNSDSLSIASSTHFTVVNDGVYNRCRTGKRNKGQSRSCCTKHKLTVLILTMSTLFMFGIIVAVYLFEMRAMHIRNSTER